MLNLTLLGGFDASLDGHPLTGFSYNTMRALLAYLALAPLRDHRREFLAGLLWEGQDMSTARGNLRRTLSDLRRVIEAPTGKKLFIADKHSLRFNPDLSVDVVNFTKPLLACDRPSGQQDCQDCLKSMEQTAALYRGEFLQDFALAECSAFDEWLLIQRETLHRHALALLERIANCHEMLGHYANALPFALRFVALEPTDESGHRRVMRLYALDRQPGAALHQYKKCAQLLKHELAVLPEESTQSLARQIRLGEVGTDLPAPMHRLELKWLSTAQAERRQVTVFYCELNLKDGLDSDDPEEILERLHAPQAHCLEIVRHHGGHIVQAHGGGLLVYFGYPLANEHAARHAVNAALAIVQDSATMINARIGVHTGMIITGLDPSIPDTVGHTSRLAIQLRQGLAQNENGVVISPATYAIVNHYYHCVDLELLSSIDPAQSTHGYRVECASGARSRLDAATRLTPMIGRQHELTRLQALWLQAMHGQGQLLLLQGEPGIGKSRLIHRFRQTLPEDSAVTELRCFAESKHSPFHPVIALLESYFSLDPKDTPQQKLHKITSRLALHAKGQDRVAVLLLANLFGLPQEHQAHEMTAQEVKQRTSSLLAELILSMTTGKRTLLIWEDLHWADSSTLEFLNQFIERARLTGILLLLTARPGFIPHWKASAQHTLTLSPLDQKEMTKMIIALDATLPGDTVARIIDQTDGIPLFIEEIVTNITSASSTTIPATLQDLLAARIDQLGQAKATAQLASCIGREFDLRLLQASSTCSAPEIDEHLSMLRESGLLIELEQTTVQFKHALIQDVCYQSQTRTVRRSAHQHIAQALLREFPHLVATRQELVAQHLFASGNITSAAEYWAMAGRRDVAVGANNEAIEHLNAALQALHSLPPDNAHTRMETMIYLNLGTAWMSAGGYGCDEARQAHLKAMSLSGDEKDDAGLFATLRRLWMADYMYRGSSVAFEMAQQMLRLAQQSGDPVQLQAAHDAFGVSIGSMGDSSGALYHYLQATALYRPEHHAEMVSRFGENVALNCGVHMAMTLWIRGYPEQSRARMESTLDIARAQPHPHSLGIALYGCALISRWRRDVDASARYVEESIALANEFDMPFWQLLAEVDQAWINAMRGRKSEVLALPAQLQANPEIPDAARILFFQQLADGLIHLKLYPQALALLNEAITLAKQRDERYLEADYHLMKGICQMEISADADRQAVASFEKALSICRQQGALSFELRASAELAKLWHKTGCPQQATRLLKEICAQFEEGLDSVDFRAATALL